MDCNIFDTSAIQIFPTHFRAFKKLGERPQFPIRTDNLKRPILAIRHMNLSPD